MVHVMSSQLLWPTTAKTENPRKEPTNSPQLLFNDVTTQWVTLSNNDPWAIWAICNYESLLIDLKISSHMCWPFRTRVHSRILPVLWSGQSHAWTAWLDWPSMYQWQDRKHKIRSQRGLYTSVLYAVGYIVMPSNLKELYFSHADRLSKIKLAALLMG